MHQDLIKHMLSGASRADVALLMVPGNKGNHKKCEIQGQKRQHARLYRLLGIQQLIVDFNKMDDASVNRIHDRCNEIHAERQKMSTKLNINQKQSHLTID